MHRWTGRCALLGILLFGVASHAPAAWEFETAITVPYNNTLFVARDNQDNIYATTFNNTGRSAQVVAFKITGALGPKPEATAFDRFLAPPGRGYAGITVDEDGAIYLSADQGDGNPSFIKKFKPTLEPDPAFGTNGVLATKKLRVLGLAASGRRIFAAVNWARLIEIDSTGKYLGISPEPPSATRPTIRDIAFVPATGEVAGVDRDTVYLFSGGSPDNLASYSLKTLYKSGQSKSAAGNGIYFDQADDGFFFTLYDANQMGYVKRATGQGSVLSELSVGGNTLQPADAVLSSDRTALFVTDLRSPNLARFRPAGYVHPGGKTATPGPIAMQEKASAPAAAGPARVVPDLPSLAGARALEAAATEATAGGPPPGAVVSPTPEVAPPAEAAPATGAGPAWESDLAAAFQRAASPNRKVAALFVTGESERARELEQKLFGPAGLPSKYPELVWVKVDVSRNPEVLKKYGFFKVPLLILFNAQQAELKRFDGVFTAEQFAAGYSEFR